MELLNIPINKPADVNVVVGQAHFIKTVEDLYEVIVSSSSTLKFGVAFCEASGASKVRVEGNDQDMQKVAAQNAQTIGAGHSFIVALKDGFPINVLNAIKGVSEVCSVFAATANPLEVIVVDNGSGRGILGVIDGVKPKGIENADDINWRKGFLRQIGYKR